MKVILITGESGVGKSTFAKLLSKIDSWNYEIVKSFTTRPQRDKHDTDHIFIPLEANLVAQRLFGSESCVARTIINGELYFTIKENFHPFNTNLYIIDNEGIEYLQSHYPNWNTTIVKIVSNEVNIPENRKNRNITIPKDDECDIIIKREGIQYRVIYRKQEVITDESDPLSYSSWAQLDNGRIIMS